MWGEGKVVDLRPARNNLFIVQFDTSKARDRVLERGPYHVQNQLLLVRKWEPDMNLVECYWNSLYMDRYTTERKRLEYARGCPKQQQKSIKQVWKPKARQVDERNILTREEENVVESLHIEVDKGKVVVTLGKCEGLTDITNVPETSQISSKLGSNSGSTHGKGKKASTEITGVSSKGGSQSRFALLKEEEDMDVVSATLDTIGQPRQQREAKKKFTQMMNTIKPDKGGRRNSRAGEDGLAGTISSK
ncbi:hypothetical protein PTKIN_Ptkin06aG0089500 [Pterospermum kingtungense]